MNPYQPHTGDMDTTSTDFEGNDILAKLAERCRLIFSAHGGEIMVTGGDDMAREMFNCDFEGLPFQCILGPASCRDTVEEIYSCVFNRRSCEAYLNLYGADGKWYTSHVSFRLVPYMNDEAFRQAGEVIFGVISVAKPCVVAGDIDTLMSSGIPDIVV